jgi:hypothetical protein
MSLVGKLSVQTEKVQKESEPMVTSFHKKDWTKAIKIGGKWFQK